MYPVENTAERVHEHADLQLSYQMNVFRLQRIEFFVDLLCKHKALTQIEADGRLGRGGRDVESATK